MVPVLPLPRLLFGAGALSGLAGELTLLGVRRPLLLSDRGLERAGAVAAALRALPQGVTAHLDTPENPTVAGADIAYADYRAGACDGVVALGGGSVIDTAKILAALAGTALQGSAELLGQPERIGRNTVPLVAIPTTVGTGSESSPVSALHTVPGGPAIGTRSPFLVPRVAICDPDLVRTLPRRLIAATGVDALSHCIEGFFAEPANPVIDALALDGIARVFADIRAALEPEGDAARASLMAAAFAGGAAIHKGLGPAHAIALVCGDQDLHHGTLIAAALPVTTELLARHVPGKAARVAAALGLATGEEIAPALRTLMRELGLPATYKAAGYVAGPLDTLIDGVVASHFNRTSAYVPTREEYGTALRALVA
ncbi:iron-containing alcohol dehydrogenase [Caulobacter sp. S45]|uniref:iron-containing alcohol dehydrogenase n=1 Tax=Caulobacter sp. S45 TaxID=1641861 RepID=UPI001575E610|nr:iron-containing alcohol dehydrogenase [Caulobacter sp. S45]